LALIRAVALPLLVLSGGVAMFMLLAVGGPMAIEGTISVGELVAFAALLTVLLPTLRSMGWLLSVLARGRASLERIFELLDAPESVTTAAPGVVVETGGGPSISLKNLTFSYPDEPERQVLDGLTIDLPAGSMVGLFGRTGSGKSTLLRVLARLYDPPRGSVFIDGTDVLDLDLAAWRRRMAVVPQRPFLFSDTIASNVALERDADQRRIEQAVAAAALVSDIEALQYGMDTIVGERGIMLSGGQRQRVALARGLYRRGDLLILDDVLSAVDHATEAGLVDSLTDLSGIDGGPTVLIASHRLSALRRTDLVLVLDRGRLIDTGHHDELVKRPGIYRETWLAQRAGTASTHEAAS
ncbi:MAG: ABC transporter ATP-binding protein, partial [Acidobacteria bacterium]|nr:ABC transporter ATP-binding protein [Acidobacteriota bacterium]